MKVLRILIFLVVLFLCGYTITNFNETSKETVDWKGSDINNLISSWGKADLINTNSKGEKLYTYIESFGTDSKGKENPLYWQINSYKIKYYCETIFTVDSLNLIIDVTINETSWNDK
jgi:hypothetical protein